VLNLGKNPVIASIFWAVALFDPSLAIFRTKLFFKAVSMLDSSVKGSPAKIRLEKKTIVNSIKTIMSNFLLIMIFHSI
jgi:hypothetical protein